MSVVGDCGGREPALLFPPARLRGEWVGVHGSVCVSQRLIRRVRLMLGLSILTMWWGCGLSAHAGVENEPLLPVPPRSIFAEQPGLLRTFEEQSPDGVSLVEYLPPVPTFGLDGNEEPIVDPDAERPPDGRTPASSFRQAAPLAMGGFWAPAVPVQGQPADLAMNSQFARVAMPIGTPAEGKPIWLGISKFGRLELATDAILPDSGQPIPRQLWLVETGFMHIRPLAGGATIGGTFLIGSASDRPYAAGRDLTLMAIAFYNRPAKNERDEWNFGLFYSPTSQLPYPLPGLAYVWRPSEEIEAKIGLPGGLEYRPTEDWSFSVGYTPLVNVNAIARRRLGEQLSAIAFYRTDTEIYFLADRVRDDERFYVFNQRAAVGIERVLTRGFALELTANYLFDRKLFQGTNFTSGRTDVVNFDPGLGLSAQLLWRR